MAETIQQRYQRQMLLPGIGKEGQDLLQAAKVLIIGAGGLGCPALLYLAAAGVGTIGIVDGDQVEVSNLPRQILFSTNDIGKKKAIVAAQKLTDQYPDCNINSYPIYLEAGNAWDLVAKYDWVVDGSDNFPTRYLVNDLCVLQKKTWVYGAIYRFQGQVAVFSHLNKKGVASAQYRDLFTQPPAQVPDCSEAGVMGVLPGIIGTMQANEVIKLVTNTGRPLINKLLTYNSLDNQVFEIELQPTQAGTNAVPATRQLLENTDYKGNCKTTLQHFVNEIRATEFDLLANQGHINIIDVREYGEEPLLTTYKHLRLPISSLIHHLDYELPSTDLVFICQTGIRSLKAAEMLRGKLAASQKIYSLKGGINDWLKMQKTPGGQP